MAKVTVFGHRQTDWTKLRCSRIPFWGHKNENEILLTTSELTGIESGILKDKTQYS